MIQETRYRAFISYSHADKAWADWLHRRLEGYRVPRHLVGTPGLHGPVPARIGRCFRDAEELSAASGLGETLQKALRESSALVIVCSPRSAQSRWVNEEIRHFRSLGRGERIYALIVAGAPEATGSAEGCFPPALLEAHTDPLAADVRAGRDDKDDGFIKIAAALLGVGYDDLRRREQRRRSRWLLGIAATSAAIASLTLVLAALAYQARNEARFERDQAAGLVSFMLGDLKNRLEMFGRLDVLDAAVNKAVEHLEARQTSPDARALAARSEALAAVADIRYARGDLPGAIASAGQAVAAARELMERAPGPVARMRLASALYSLGEPSLEGGAFQDVLPQTIEGRALAQELVAADPQNPDYRLLVSQLDDQYAYILARGPAPDVDEADKVLQHCIEALRPAAYGDATESRYWRFLLRCHVQRSIALWNAAKALEAGAAFGAFLAEADRAKPAVAADRAASLMLQMGYLNATYSLSAIGHLDDAGRASSESLRLGRQLVAFEPENAEWQRQLGLALRAGAIVRAARGERSVALDHAAEAMALFDQLLGRNPDSTNIRRDSMNVRRLRAALEFRASGGLATALKHLDAAVALMRPGDTDVGLRITSLEILLQQWLYAADRAPAVARRAEMASRRLFEDLVAVVPPEQIAVSRVALGYLDGRLDDSDAAYPSVRSRATLMLGVEQFREFACARLAREGGRCRPLEESAGNARS